MNLTEADWNVAVQDSLGSHLAQPGVSTCTSQGFNPHVLCGHIYTALANTGICVREGNLRHGIHVMGRSDKGLKFKLNLLPSISFLGAQSVSLTQLTRQFEKLFRSRQCGSFQGKLAERCRFWQESFGFSCMTGSDWKMIPCLSPDPHESRGRRQGWKHHQRQRWLFLARYPNPTGSRFCTGKCAQSQA